MCQIWYQLVLPLEFEFGIGFEIEWVSEEIGIGVRELISTLDVYWNCYRN